MEMPVGPMNQFLRRDFEEEYCTNPRGPSSHLALPYGNTRRIFIEDLRYCSLGLAAYSWPPRLNTVTEPGIPIGDSLAPVRAGESS